jgi:hypothetical protein
MAEKKFAGINGAVTSAEVSADYEAAPVFDKVRVGKLGVYFRDGFKTRFMDYSLLERVFIRIQEVNGRMCCGNATFAYYRLVFVVNGKEFVDTISENEKAMDNALAKIKESAPKVAIGFVGKE